ncbi:MAG: hypothetical protein U1F36_08610 [Planctomycetota bacterium]
MTSCKSCGRAFTPDSAASPTLTLCPTCAASSRRSATLVLSLVLLAMVVAIGFIFYRAFSAGR